MSMRHSFAEIRESGQLMRRWVILHFCSFHNLQPAPPCIFDVKGGPSITEPGHFSAAVDIISELKY